jgi:hypothetical protein
MGPFWSSLFGHLKDCGRNATLFICIFAGLLGAILLFAVLLQSSLHDYVIKALPWASALLFLWGGVAVFRACMRRRDRPQRPPLSEDEIIKARSKLIRPRNSR